MHPIKDVQAERAGAVQEMCMGGAAATEEGERVDRGWKEEGTERQWGTASGALWMAVGGIADSGPQTIVPHIPPLMGPIGAIWWFLVVFGA